MQQMNVWLGLGICVAGFSGCSMLVLDCLMIPICVDQAIRLHSVESSTQFHGAMLR